MQNVRIFFEKKGMAKYISHLDLMRCFSRAIKRTDIDIWYTQGFNPHPFMTFSMPLSLGTESYCETVDIRINNEMPFKEITQKLKTVMPEDINIVNAAAPVHKADEICYAEYDIIFTLNESETLASKIESVISADEIIVEKKVKQGRKKVLKQIDIKENIKSYCIKNTKNTVLLNIVLTAGVKDNVNPSLIINAIFKDFDDFTVCTDIIKQNVYLSDLTKFN